MTELAMPTRRPLRPGLLDLYLIRGVAGPFLLVTLAAGSAMMLERALRLIHELAARGADLGYFLPLLLRLAPYYLDLALPAAFMVSLMLLVARLDDRLELEAMLASGLSLGRIALPLAGFGVLIALASLVAGGWLEPLGRYGFRALRVEAVNAGQAANLQPGAIYQAIDDLAFSFDRRGADGRLEGIFVWQRLQDGRELVLTGRAGRAGFSARDGLFGIDFAGGRYVAQRPGGGAPSVVAFDSMAFRQSMRLEDSSWQRGWDQNELTLPELLDAPAGSSVSPRALETEFYSRLARVAIIPLLPFLVLPLAFATKKGRRTAGIVLAGALLAAFHHGLTLSKRLALGGTIEPVGATLGAAALCAAIAMLVFLSGRHLPSHSPIATLLRPFGWASPQRGARALPSLKGATIAVYLSLRLLKWTLIALVAVAGFLQLVDLFERGDDFVARDMGLADVARYAWLQLPALLQQALPVAALAGAMVVFADFGRSREMVAIRGAGVSQYRILLMALPVPLLLAAASLSLAEQAVPKSQLALADWWGRTVPAARAEAPPARWFHLRDEIVRAQAAGPDGRLLTQIDIFRRDAHGLIAERLAAARATEGTEGWTLHDVRRSRYAPGGVASEDLPRLAWPVALQPDDVATFFAAPPALSSAAAQRALDAAAPVSRAAALFETRLHRRAAEPLAPLVMLLLALPLAFVSPRTDRAWPALLYAGGGGLLYLVADGVLTVAAQVGYLPAAVGAWTAPILALLVATTVLLYWER
ncbi:MAG: LptF/LptG family permease [Sphingosinicella sp.]|uniref:LptF/LptG family permease n=1 Tax=Sphingosinicella sp. TaxID=1917971 RepID=UPI004037E68F